MCIRDRPYAKKQGVVHRVTDRAFEKGLIAYHSVGCADGVNGDVVMLGPPLIVNEAQVAEMVTLLAEAIQDVCSKAL